MEGLTKSVVRNYAEIAKLMEEGSNARTGTHRHPADRVGYNTVDTVLWKLTGGMLISMLFSFHPTFCYSASYTDELDQQ